MAKRKTWIFVLALCVGSSAGCGTGKKTVPVEGTVTLDERPMADVHIIFYPTPEETTNQSSYRYTALTDEQGRFVMRGDEESEGVPPGKYQVTLTTAVAKQTADETTPLPPERVPAKYRNGKLEFEVPEGGTKQANFDLKTK